MQGRFKSNYDQSSGKLKSFPRKCFLSLVGLFQLWGSCNQSSKSCGIYYCLARPWILETGTGRESVLFYLVFLSVILESMPKREPDRRMASKESWWKDPDYGHAMKNQSRHFVAFDTLYTLCTQSVALKMLPLSPYSCDASVFLC